MKWKSMAVYKYIEQKACLYILHRMFDCVYLWLQDVIH